MGIIKGLCPNERKKERTRKEKKNGGILIEMFADAYVFQSRDSADLKNSLAVCLMYAA